MAPSVSRLLDVPPLTAAAAFQSVAPPPGVALDVGDEQVRLRGPSLAAVTEVAAHMQAWIDDWVDAAGREVFVHPALRARQAPPRP